MKYLLIKFGNEEHLRMLQTEGLLYCKSVLEFAKMENDHARGDKFESIIQLELLNDKEIWLKPQNNANEKWKKININYGQAQISKNEYEGNLFCMSYFPIDENSDKTELSINNRFLSEFGTHYLLILNQPEFFNRVDNVLRKDKIEYARGCVEYLDLKNFTGLKSIFQKDNYFLWQSEYRIYMQTGKKELQTYNIGNIEDISHLGKLTELTSFHIRKTRIERSS